MKKQYLSLFILLMIGISSTKSFAQADLANSSKLELGRIEKVKQKNKGKRTTGKHTQSQKEYLGGIMMVTEEFNQNDITQLGGEIGSQSGSIVSFSIPYSSFEPMTQLKGISYIELDSKGSIKPRLDKLKTSSNVNKVHEGVDLPQGYSGEGVIVGVIDFGFQINHPVFRNDNGALRIKRVWIQNDTVGLPHPDNYSYGKEMVDTVEMLNLKATSLTGSHGTHVASIAGGNGLNNQYVGVAYNADLVFVQPDFEKKGKSAVMDAIAYIFAYADEEGKPAVINMSLGNHVGPHDGTSLLDRFIDGAVGEGKVIVGSGGNEGSMNMHVGYELIEFDTLKTFLGDNGSSLTLDIWGEVGTEFSFNIGLLDLTSFENISEMEFVSSTTDLSEEYIIGDTIAVIVTVDSSSMLNNKPNVTINVHYEGETGSSNIFAFLQLTGTTGKINAWNENASGFSSQGFDGFIDGDNSSTVGEIGGTASGIITVGAYTIDTAVITLEGDTSRSLGNEIEGYASFSSQGPTADGRMKPEITAPGDFVISAVNFYHEGLFDSYPPVAGHKIGEDTVYFAGASGTSMSSPAVAGTVALLLEVNPTATAAEIKTILTDHAKTDNFTGDLSAGSNLWGAGKLDAFVSIESVTSITAIHSTFSSEENFELYPNPSNDVVNISFSSQEMSVKIIRVVDVTGAVVLEQEYTNEAQSNVKLNVSNLNQGVYTISGVGNNGNFDTQFIKR